MALADYFHRSALAVAQIAHGYDEERLRLLLGATSVSVSIGNVDGPEGDALADLVVRLVSRLYPQLTLEVRERRQREQLAALAREINPLIELGEGQSELGLVIGDGIQTAAKAPIFLGSDRWNAFMSSREPLRVGDSANPFGAGVAACLGVAALFRQVVLGSAPPSSEAAATVTFSAWTCDLGQASGPDVDAQVNDAVLVGGGAIGNAATWALARTQLSGSLHIVDHEAVELSNLQRYVLAVRSDDGATKANLLSSWFQGRLSAIPSVATWQDFVASQGYAWRWALVGLDSARDRRAVQASLPEHIINAWTQPGDLGVSVHPALDAGACLSCLYLPAGQVPNEDELVAHALGLDHARFGLQIRQLLDAGGTPPRELLDEVAAHLQVERDQIGPYETRPLRDLYVEGICGGGLVSLDRLGSPHQELHVPLAHQSTLAGVLLAARYVRLLMGEGPDRASVTRLNVMREISHHPTQAAAKRDDGLCICQDPVYALRYDQKWREGRSLASA
ncbi:MAG: E2 ligase fold family C protein [Solirubrobacteraceae bacterium]